MSELGQKRKSARLRGMSALPSKSRPRQDAPACPKSANSEHAEAACKNAKIVI
jgi:hypothetical protein